MKKLFKFYLVAFLLFLDFAVHAQPGDDTGGGGLEGNDPPPASIDNKLIILFIIGVLYVLYTYRQKRKQVEI